MRSRSSSSWAPVSLPSDQGKPSTDSAEPTIRVRTSARQRISVRSEMGTSPSSANEVQSSAASTPSRSLRATVSRTELVVVRPRQSSAGMREPVEPSQKMTRRIGSRSWTSPLERSFTDLR